MATPNNNDSNERESWEKEIFLRHRWGQHGEERTQEELTRLKPLWDAAQPLDKGCRDVLEQIIAIEICNWDLENAILLLCGAINSKEARKLLIGHLQSVTDERWKQIWAYYLTLRDWLPSLGRSGFQAVLEICDPDKEVNNHVLEMLGERNELKEHYVERVCLCLEFWLGGYWEAEHPQIKGHSAAIKALDEEIEKREPGSKILQALHLEGDGRLQPCNHKAFRRYDIILSSIGTGEWRASMPMRGTDGFERAEVLEKYLSPIQEWVDAHGKMVKKDYELSRKIHSLLGEPDDAGVFLASFLVSILRAQQLAAQKRAESRANGT